MLEQVKALENELGITLGSSNRQSVCNARVEMSELLNVPAFTEIRIFFASHHEELIKSFGVKNSISLSDIEGAMTKTSIAKGRHKDLLKFCYLVSYTANCFVEF